MKRYIVIFAVLASTWQWAICQPVPAPEENIPHLMIFGKDAETSWGDDDYCLIFFFAVPKDFSNPVYIRVFDPDTGGEIDEINGEFNSRMSYDVYGGTGSYSDEDARETQPVGNYRSGNLLASRVFGLDPEYDNTWFTFGPFNPTEGEYVRDFDANIFKIIVQGIAGDDGNLYNFYLSQDPDNNVPVEGANAFTYEYSFRLHNNPNNVSHIYPYVDDRVVSVRQENFDWDNDGIIRTVSVARNSQFNVVSGEENWASSEFGIYPEEKNHSLDFQFIKRKDVLVRNNNVVISVRNQYGELMPFFTVPIGGVPKYQYSISVEKKTKKY